MKIAELEKQKRIFVSCIIICMAIFAIVCTCVVVFSSYYAVSTEKKIINIEYTESLSWTDVVDDLGGNMVEIYCEGKTSVSSGSGFVITYDGDSPIVMTNHHVVDDAIDSSDYTLYVKTIYESGEYTQTCEVLGYDEYHDVAILKLSDTAYKSESFIDFLADEETYFGDTVMGEDVGAIGNAIGEGLGFVSGVVSKHSTAITYTDTDSVSSKTIPVIQMTAATNSGMSGSALVNKSGQIVGICTYKATSYDDINYAVDIDIALSVYDDVMSGRMNSSNEVTLLKVTSGNYAYRTCLTGESDGNYYFNAFGSYYRYTYNNVIYTTATLYSGLGFSGQLLAGKGSDSTGLVSQTENIGVEVTSSNVSGLTAGDVIVSINGNELDGTYDRLFEVMFGLTTTKLTSGGDTVVIETATGKQVSWAASNGYRVVAK